MPPKSNITAATNPTKTSAETASKPKNQSPIGALAKHAFAAREETPSVPTTESDSRVKELFGLYGLLEARVPEVQKIPLSQESEKLVTGPAITTDRQAKKMPGVSSNNKATELEPTEKAMTQTYASLGDDYEEVPRGAEMMSDDEGRG